MEEEDDYGDILDEDLIGAFSQPSQDSQTLPQLNAKRRRSRDSIENYDSEDEETNAKKKKPKYVVHVTDRDVPAAQILGATQAEALPDSSPYKIRGPIYKKPRLEPESEPPKPPQFFAPRQQVTLSNNSIHTRNTRPALVVDLEQDFGLEDSLLDAFSSPDRKTSERPVTIGSSLGSTQAQTFTSQRLGAPQQGLRQTTLFGGKADNKNDHNVSTSQANNVRNYKVDRPPEPPTHHALDGEALKTWVYPMNLGTIRDYQYSIVRNGLFNNLLVALPTGLGKTCIAATIMLNYYRWTKDSQIVFVAPTKPLVAQQVDACFNIVGIPKSQTTLLTGEQPPALRAEEWREKRVFFMTPQTLHNDLASGAADPKKIVLLVVDEAHRATGNYAYVTVVNFLRRFNKCFRILALTATPGASVEAVQEVIDNLEIAKVEIRTEESLDIQQYVHRRNIDQIVLDPSDEIVMVKELFAKALQPLVNQLCAQNAYWQKDPMSLTPFGLMQARANWFKSDAGRRANPGIKGMMNGLFTVLASVAHGIKLLNFHGIAPFYANIQEFRQGVEDANKPGKYRSQIVDSTDFQKMMTMIRSWLSMDGFIGHPKMTYLCDTILNHFLDAGEGKLGTECPPSSTRVIVFAEFRDSAEDIARVLNRIGDGLIRASVFVGQADSKRSEGMNQAKQHETIAKFKSGTFNVIVATSIGEEGLDIGQVDLIVCYDASASPIRMLQRMGRTGRKRAGNVVLLLMRGKEEESFAKAKDNYEQMQRLISDGTRFKFRYDLSVRIMPKGMSPVVDKRMIEIPVENTQDPGLPEPKRRAGKVKKKAVKKFHMPDGVETGFRTASRLNLLADGALVTDHGITMKRAVIEDVIAVIPPLASVLLSAGEEKELERLYQNVAGNDKQEVTLPDLTSQAAFQRSLGPVSLVKHTQYTRRCVGLFKILSESQLDRDRHIWPYGQEEPLRGSWNRPKLYDDIDEDEDFSEAGIAARALTEAVLKRKQTTKPPKAKPSPKEKPPLKTKPRPMMKQAAKKKHGLSSSDTEDDGPGRDASSDESEGEGEILYSEEPSKDSDDGEDLRDFIAGTNDTIIEASQSTAYSNVTALQKPESDDEPREASQIVGTVRATRIEGLDSDELVPLKRRGKRRQIVETSDSDE